MNEALLAHGLPQIVLYIFKSTKGTLARARCCPKSENLGKDKRQNGQISSLDTAEISFCSEISLPHEIS